MTASNNWKKFQKVLCLLPLVLCANLAAKAKHPGTAGNEQPQLQVKALIVDSTYCSASNLRLSLELSFHNTGSLPILLRKDGFRIGRYLINQNAGGLRKGKLEADVAPTLNSLWVLMNRFEGRATDESVVVKLVPGATHMVSIDLFVPFIDDVANRSPDYLRPGNYLLQVLVWTWLDTESVATRMQEERKGEGFLWTKSVMSEPIQFTISDKKTIKSCN